MMQLFDPNTVTVAAFVVAPGTYADGVTSAATGALNVYFGFTTATTHRASSPAGWSSETS